MTLNQSVHLVCGHITPGKLSSPSEAVVDLLPEHLLVSGVFQFNFYQATAGPTWVQSTIATIYMACAGLYSGQHGVHGCSQQ